ncbi:Uncharacterized protein Adt_18347 [Abeliophyllum distichum]|uniref:RNase H type-1 domain-containing protein n=1 Tax=Abeliophyllum distichum TaxID=126358 RepID=A0ABD1TJ50_9LAMI
MKPPKAILKKLEGIFARFLWDSRNDAPRLHWKRWKDLCIPTVRELFDDTGWNTSKLFKLVSYIIAEQIGNIPITAESPIIPTSVSFFCWRLWQGLIPIDVVIQRRIGSHMASRCQCCSAIETIQHLFIDSCIANQHTPLEGFYKVNTDGCVKDGFVSGGGIIKDSSGQCVRAFFSSYGECHILEAELPAIFYGIILAQRLVLSNLWIESDSTLAIHCITRGGLPWYIQATLCHIKHLLTFDRGTISHIYREGNQVADLLTSEGWDRRCYFEYSTQDLPRRYRSLVQIDKHGIPTVRGL